MANLFSSIFKRAGDLVSYPVEASYKTITNPKEGLDMWKNLYTHNTHEDQDLFQNGFGIRGWVGDHPQESAAAVVASIFGGWAAAGGAGGAGGTAAAGTGAASAVGSGASGLGAAGTTGVGATAAGTGAGTGALSGSGLSAAGFGSGTTGVTSGFGAGSIGATPFAAGSTTLSYAPSSATVLGGSGGSLTAGGTVGAGSAGATAGTGFGSTSVGATPFSEGSSVLSYSPTQSPVLSETPSVSGGQSTDWNQIAQQLNRMQQQQDQQNKQQQPQIQMARAGQYKDLTPQSNASTQAQQNLQQLLGNNPYSTNPFRRT